jgi:hypothetical protein
MNNWKDNIREKIEENSKKKKLSLINYLKVKDENKNFYKKEVKVASKVFYLCYLLINCDGERRGLTSNKIKLAVKKN